MTNLEKAKKLQEYCNKHHWCKNCELNSYKCGMFASWLDRNDLISDNDVEEAYNTVFGKEDENMFTKEDLEDGMVVKTREGDYYLVCGDSFIRDKGFLEINTYNNDLTNMFNNADDIVTVYGKIYTLCALNNIEYNTALWKREEVKEMTVAEIEKELGYKVNKEMTVAEIEKELGYSIKIIKGDNE